MAKRVAATVLGVFVAWVVASVFALPLRSAMTAAGNGDPMAQREGLVLLIGAAMVVGGALGWRWSGPRDSD